MLKPEQSYFVGEKLLRWNLNPQLTFVRPLDRCATVLDTETDIYIYRVYFFAVRIFHLSIIHIR